MAIDTESKRRSAYWGMGVWNVMPVPDGTVHAADRPHARWIYAGIVIAAITGNPRRTFRGTPRPHVVQSTPRGFVVRASP